MTLNYGHIHILCYI